MSTMLHFLWLIVIIAAIVPPRSASTRAVGGVVSYMESGSAIVIVASFWTYSSRLLRKCRATAAIAKKMDPRCKVTIPLRSPSVARCAVIVIAMATATYYYLLQGFLKNHCCNFLLVNVTYGIEVLNKTSTIFPKRFTKYLHSTFIPQFPVLFYTK